MNYAAAHELLVRTATRIRRSNWPPGVFLLHVPGSTITVDPDRPLGKAAPELVGQQVHYGSHVDIFSGGYLNPWFPLPEDRDAENWETR